jgi:hypothetical protein
MKIYFGYKTTTQNSVLRRTDMQHVPFAMAKSWFSIIKISYMRYKDLRPLQINLSIKINWCNTSFIGRKCGVEWLYYMQLD